MVLLHPHPFTFQRVAGGREPVHFPERHECERQRCPVANHVEDLIACATARHGKRHDEQAREAQCIKGFETKMRTPREEEAKHRHVSKIDEEDPFRRSKSHK